MPEIIVKLGESIVHKHLVYKDEVKIGRSPDNDIAIENLAVSRHHASLRKVSDHYVVEDMNSANGTYVNGVRVTKTEVLDKDVITIGKHKLHFYAQDKEEEPEPAGAMDYAQKTMVVAPEPVMIACLRVHGKQEDEVYELAKVETRIGRAADNDVRLGDWFVSKHHAMIIRKGMIYVLRDLASWRHTFVNGQMVQEQPLKMGDEIQFGPKVKATFELKDADRDLGRVPVEMANMTDSMIGNGGSRRKVVSAMPVMEDPKWTRSAEGLAESSDSADSCNEVHIPVAGPEAEAVPDQVEEIAIDELHAVCADCADENSEEQAESPEIPKTAVWGMDNVLDRVHERAVGTEDSSIEFNPEAAQSDWLPESEQAEWSEESNEAKAWEAEGQEEEFTRRAHETLEAPAGDDDDGALALGDEPAAPEQPSESGREEEKVAASQPAADEAHRVAVEMSSVAGQLSGAEPEEVALWLRALENPSKVIRKQAQRKLKQLTGRDYDIE
jgi:pSer/pThr/pTyr-binding forkhead associated (FHA) protein